MPTNRNLRSVASALLSLAMVVLLLAACPRGGTDNVTAVGDPFNVPATITPGPAPPDPHEERRIAQRASRSRVEAAEAAAVAAAEAERVRVLRAAEAHALAAQRAAAAAMAPRPQPTGDVWWALGNCESGNNPRAVGGGGRYFGAFQQSAGSWGRFGNGGAILEQPYSEQLASAKRQQAAEGWGPWPHCSRKLGLR